MTKRLGQIQENKMHLALSMTSLFISKVLETDYLINTDEFIEKYAKDRNSTMFTTLLRDFIVERFADSQSYKNGNRIKIYERFDPDYEDTVTEIETPGYEMPMHVKDIMKYGMFRRRKKNPR
jgi:hypothetical protein